MPHRTLSQPPPLPPLAPASTLSSLSPAPPRSPTLRPQAHKKFSLGAAERLRFYRKCFHELNDQFLQHHTGNSSSAALGNGTEVDATLLQAEMCFLEEIIMLFTRISIPISSGAVDVQAKPKLLLGGESSSPDYRTAGNDEMDLSSLTDILILSATSPWTLYVTERTQWQLCYVSPSVRHMLGWRPAELVGILSWDGCHPDDVPILRRMLQLSDSGQVPYGTTVVYRRMRKDRNYSTIQATGRAVGTRWYAWVEQDMSTFSAPLQHIPRADAGDADTLANMKSRRHSNDVRPSQDRTEGPNGRTWSTTVNLLSSSPTAPTHGFAEKQQTAQRMKLNHVESVDLAKTTINISGEEAQALIKGGAQGIPTISHSAGNILRSEGNEKVWRGCPSQDDTENASATMSFKPKLPISSQKENASLQTWSGATMDEFGFLIGKKVLLAEDDAVNRAIGKRLLESLKCEVTVACNGREALDILQRNPAISPDSTLDGKELPAVFDLVLMDLLMPVMDGTLVVEKFRDWEAEQVPPRKRMVIFAVTANVSDGDMVKCAQSGFDEFVSKPLTVDKLLDRFTKRTAKEK